MGIERTAIDAVLRSYQRLESAVNDFRSMCGSASAALEVTKNRDLKSLESAHIPKLKALETAHQTDLRRAESQYATDIQKKVLDPIRDATSRVGLLAADWSDAKWASWSPDALQSKAHVLPGVVRVGAFQFPVNGRTESCPTLLPILGQKSVLLHARGQESQLARSALQSMALRVCATFPIGSFRLTLVDAASVAQNLKQFLRLPAEIRGDRIVTDQRSIEKELSRLVDHLDQVTQSRLRDFANIEQYNAASKDVTVPYQFVIISDFPAGFSELACQLLINLLKNGPRAGIFVFATVSAGDALPGRIRLDELTSLCANLEAKGNLFNWDDLALKAYPVKLDIMPSDSFVNVLLDRVGEFSIRDTGAGLPYRKIAIPKEEIWSGNSTAGISVPIGIDTTGRQLSFELGKDVVHHGLIGGATRMGKTNLLHVLITQLASKYPPDELHFYMIDFKEGVEFQDYVTLQLPHARVISITSEPEFGLSVLREMQREIERRGVEFRASKSATIKEHRETTGQIMPRILLLMDEYQILFGDDGSHSLSSTASASLGDLVRRGAAFGIHVLLSSQSPASSFTGNRAAMNQLALRVSLRCSESDARLILGEGNDAAKRLERPGEAVYNAGNGLPERNQFLQIARLDPAERKSRLEILALRANEPSNRTRFHLDRPVVFEANAEIGLLDNPEFVNVLTHRELRTATAPLRLWFGEAIEIKPHTRATIERKVRSNLLIAGNDERAGHALLTAAILSACAQRVAGSLAVTILALGRQGQPWSGIFFDIASSVPHPVELISSANAADHIQRLATLVAERKAAPNVSEPDHLFVIAGIDRLSPLRETDNYGSPGPSAAQFATLLAEGPAVGLHVLAWTDSYGPLERVLRRQVVQNFGLRIATTMPANESNLFLDSPDASRLADGRAIFRDETQGQMEEKFKVYQLPEAESFQTVRTAFSKTQ